VYVIYVVSDRDFEARVTYDGAKVVEGSDGRIESQFIGVHVSGSTTDGPNERFEISVVLEIIVLRDHPAGAIEKTDVEYGSAERNVE